MFCDRKLGEFYSGDSADDCNEDCAQPIIKPPFVVTDYVFLSDNVGFDVQKPMPFVF